MSDLLRKRALLEWLDIEIDLSGGRNEVEKTDRWAFRQVKKVIESGKFDAESEAQRLREALEVAHIHLMKDKPHFALMDIEDALSTQSEMVIE